MNGLTKRIIEFSCEIGGVYDNPFSDLDATVFRHKGTEKWFGLMFTVPAYVFGGRTEETALNLKCPPDISYLVKERFNGVKPAYHMNKEHWITVRLDGSVPMEEIEKLIMLSYDVTAIKAKKR